MISVELLRRGKRTEKRDMRNKIWDGMRWDVESKEGGFTKMDRWIDIDQKRRGEG